MKIHEHEKEIISRMIYHRGYAVRMEQVLTDPDHPQGILVPVFDLDRIEDIRSAIARGYLDFAASYGDLYRMPRWTSALTGMRFRCLSIRAGAPTG